MSKPIDLSILIPAYNEETTIHPVVSKVNETFKHQNLHYEIIVIDDGSEDHTAESVPHPKNVQLVQHEMNKGHGAAIKTGLNHAKGRLVAVIDADGQHEPDDLVRMLKEFEKGYDLIVGARESLIKQRRGLGNIVVSWLAGVLGGQAVPDLTSGLRVIDRKKTMEFVHLYPNHFCFELTNTMSFIMTGYKVKFMRIPLILRKGGISKINTLMDGLQFVARLFYLTARFRPLRLLALLSPFLLALLFLGLHRS